MEKDLRESVSSPWALSAEAVIDSLGSEPSVGLTTPEAELRLEKFGRNILEEEEGIKLLKVIWEGLTEPMIILLLIIGIVYAFIGNRRDSLTIFGIVIAIALLEILSEQRANTAIRSLKKLSTRVVLVTRDGRNLEIESKNLVVGDILIIRSGQRVAADARLIASYGLQAEESALTGESLPVPKDAESIVEQETTIGDRSNMIFSGTVITRGRGEAVVTSTGMNTEIGRIAGLTKAVKEPKTPLQNAMRQLTIWLVFPALIMSAVVPLIGVIQGRPLTEMILTGLALSFATVPEELPIIVSTVLSLGALALYRKKALVKQLNSAETLGSVTVIATDKTGTLTENIMEVSKIYSDGSVREVIQGSFSEIERRILTIGALANDIVIRGSGEKESYIGDPIEISLVSEAKEQGISRDILSNEYVLRDELSFDTKRNMMSEIYSKGADYMVFTKGSPEAVISRSSKVALSGSDVEFSSKEREKALAAFNEMAREGLRVLAFAERKIPMEQLPVKDYESALTFVGLVGFLDPIREEVKDAVNDCRNAGIRVMMITGDHSLTAQKVAEASGIENERIITGKDIDRMTDGQVRSAVKDISIYSRISPENKLRLVRALKENGEIVAVTGDGINDAPALKQADIGISMGTSGTSVAREAADMVLMDDNFATISEAVRQGRKLFDNLKKGIGYYLSINFGLVSVFVLALILDIPFPFAPIQIILLEVFIDLGASAAYATEHPESDIMKRRPRNPEEKFMDAQLQKTILKGTLSLFFAVMTVYLTSYFTVAGDARTMAFATLMMSQVFLAFNMRTQKEPVYKLGAFKNEAIIIWAILAVFSLAVFLYVPVFEQIFGTTPLNASEWILVFAASFAGTFWMEAWKVLSGARKDQKLPSSS